MAAAAHGELDGVVQQIQRIRRESAKTNCRPPTRAGSLFSKEALLPKLVAELESA